MASFPLFTLPFLAIKEVLKCLNPLELFILSHCSKKASGFVPFAGVHLLHVRIGNDSMAIRFCNLIDGENFIDCWFDLEPTNRSNGFQEFSIKKIEPYTLTIAYFVENEENTDLWFDRLYAFKRFVPYLSNTLKWKIYQIDCTHIEPDIPLQNTIKSWLIPQNGQLAVLRIYGETTDEINKWLLENITVTDRICFSSEVEKGFKVNFDSTCKHMTIEYADWITPRKLFSFDSCKTLRLLNGNFTQKYIDIVMKEWQNGKLPNLEFLELDTAGIKTVLGYSRQQLTEKKNYIRDMPYNDLYFIRCDFGVDFKNNNGDDCSLQVNPTTNIDCVELFVWGK